MYNPQPVTDFADSLSGFSVPHTQIRDLLKCVSGADKLRVDCQSYAEPYTEAQNGVYGSELILWEGDTQILCSRHVRIVAACADETITSTVGYDRGTYLLTETPLGRQVFNQILDQLVAIIRKKAHPVAPIFRHCSRQEISLALAKGSLALPRINSPVGNCPVCCSADTVLCLYAEVRDQGWLRNWDLCQNFAHVCLQEWCYKPCSYGVHHEWVRHNPITPDKLSCPFCGRDPRKA